MDVLEFEIPELFCMKKYPKNLMVSGNTELLKRKKISIVGTRRPSRYSKDMIQKLASLLAKKGVCIVSGGAMGIDAISHRAATAKNTIAVLPCGIDIKYPSVNKALLEDIECNGLLISQFDDGFRSTPWSFVVRNELVVALGDVLIVGEADEGSGTLRSIEYAFDMGKDVYVLPQRIGQSNATNRLLKEEKVKAIYDIDEFVNNFTDTLDIDIDTTKDDEFLEFCAKNPTYDETLLKFSDRVFEAELNGDIIIENSIVYLSVKSE